MKYLEENLTASASEWIRIQETKVGKRNERFGTKAKCTLLRPSTMQQWEGHSGRGWHISWGWWIQWGWHITWGCWLWSLLGWWPTGEGIYKGGVNQRSRQAWTTWSSNTTSGLFQRQRSNETPVSCLCHTHLCVCCFVKPDKPNWITLQPLWPRGCLTRHPTRVARWRFFISPRQSGLPHTEWHELFKGSFALIASHRFSNHTPDRWCVIPPEVTNLCKHLLVTQQIRERDTLLPTNFCWNNSFSFSSLQLNLLLLRHQPETAFLCFLRVAQQCETWIFFLFPADVHCVTEAMSKTHSKTSKLVGLVVAQCAPIRHPLAASVTPIGFTQ